MKGCESIKIMLDPGHAGDYYNPSPVVAGYYESNMTWSLALKLKNALEKYGFEVGLTRQTKGEDPELTERGRRAKGCDLFLSLHSNAAATEAPDAPWLIHLLPDGKTTLDEKSVSVAKLLGPVISRIMGVSAPFYYTKGVDFDRDGNGYLDDEYYGVLFGAKSVSVPGVILEHSFHTNEKAARWLMNENNLTLLAEEEARTLADYYGMKKEEDEVTAAELERISERIARLEAAVDELKITYDFISDCPDYAEEAITDLVEKGYLMGDEGGRLRLTPQMLRTLVILHRAGVF